MVSLLHRATNIQGEPKNLRPLCLTDHTVQMPEPICMNYGKQQNCFVLNIPMSKHVTVVSDALFIHICILIMKC